MSSTVAEWSPFSVGMVGVLVATNPSTMEQFSVNIGSPNWHEGDPYNIWSAQFSGPVAVNNGTWLMLGSEQHLTIPSLPPPSGGGDTGLHINCGNDWHVHAE